MAGSISQLSERLNVIALVSGGKDSFFSLLHCLANGHRVVALANLYPASPPGAASAGSLGTHSAAIQVVLPYVRPAELGEEEEGGDENEETDLNSFMYQTVGHQVIPLYADATGLPVYRRPIAGRAVQKVREYADPGSSGRPDPGSGSLAGARVDDADEEDEEDETESMVPLLQAIKRDHPEANALSAGAILSTYQRTRVESVAVRLGLVPLAYLWKFPVLPTPRPPPPSGGVDGGGDVGDAQLLHDLGAAGVEARIVKVASGGLDESFLWENVADPAGIARLRRAMRRFGTAERGAVLGEGGEFETLVVDGPPALFRSRIAIAEQDRRVVREGGGSAWLNIRGASVVPKAEVGKGGLGDIRAPELLDAKFAAVLAELLETRALGDGRREHGGDHGSQNRSYIRGLQAAKNTGHPAALLSQHCFLANPEASSSSIQEEASSLVNKIRAWRSADPALSIVSTVVLLRRMSDFAAINSIYGSLFAAPNPPARVTIACGEQLPAGVNVAVFASTLQRRHGADGEGEGAGTRQGLHVQSRSYWAPANIGPYSQAVSVPLSSLFGALQPRDVAEGGPRLVSVAGQIPLVPATMALPRESPSGFQLSLALALQHLWRIGADVGVQWWSSAVAYVPRSAPSAGPGALREKALLAAQAWRTAHLWAEDSKSQDEDEDAEEGPDLWDRRNDFRFRAFGGDDHEKAAEPSLPDWSAVPVDLPGLGSEEDEAENGRRAAAVPPVFLAEVDELPRGAPVEWHAHVGFGHVGSGSSSRIRRFPAAVCDEVVVKGEKKDDGGKLGVRRTVHETILEAAEEGVTRRLVHTVLTYGYPPEGRTLGETELGPEVPPDFVYVDTTAWAASAAGGRGGLLDMAGSPVIPCASLWDSRGERLAAVVVYSILLEDTGNGAATS